MMKNETKPSRADLITLIVEHMVNQGIEHPDLFVEFLEDLQCYSEAALYDTLADLEALAP